MKFAAQFAALLLIPGLGLAQSSRRDSQRGPADYVLQCRGVTSASTTLKDDGPQANTKKSTDELRIVRRGGVLEVQVNIARYGSMPPKTKQALEKPDSYRIVGETGEGVVAILLNASTTLRSVTIDRSLTNAIWIESGFSFLPPQSEPISSTVFLTCTQEKE